MYGLACGLTINALMRKRYETVTKIIVLHIRHIKNVANLRQF